MRTFFRHPSGDDRPAAARTKILALSAVAVVVLSLTSSSALALAGRGPLHMSPGGKSSSDSGLASDDRWGCGDMSGFEYYWRHYVLGEDVGSGWPCNGWRPPTPTPTPTPDETTPTPDETTPTPTETTPTPTQEPTTPAPTETTGPVVEGSCAEAPSDCGFPDETNTGVEAGTSLREVPGDVDRGSGWHAGADGSIVVDGDGAVLENLIVPGEIDVTADDVTIRNVRITNDGDSWGIGLRHARDTTIVDTEILPRSARLEVGIKDVYGDASGTTITETEIARTATGIQTAQGLIEDSYIHDLAFREGDHVNGTTSNGGTRPLTIRHNTIFNPQVQTDAISLFQDFGLEANRTIDNNLLAGGGYTIYGGAGRLGITANIVITDNRISRLFFPRGGSYGPVTAFEPRGPGNEWSGNVWDEEGGKEIGPYGES